MGQQTAPAASQTRVTVADGSGTSHLLRAEVAGVDGQTPAGVVVFRAGGVELGSAVVDANGTAILNADNLPAGDSQVIAVYTGNSAHTGSVSAAALVHAQDSGLADFSVSASPASLSTTAGNYVTAVITVTPVNGFSGYVSLSCSGNPVNSACTFYPTNVQVPNGKTASSTMQIQTQAATAALRPERGPGSGLPVYAFLFPGALVFAGMTSRRRALRSGAMALFLLIAMSGLNACSARYSYLHHPPAGNPGTTLGTSTVTINALSTNGSQVTTHTTQLTLTVK